jgi:hypothetical protein
MAQKVTVEIASDLSGEGDARNVEFGLAGVTYEIDLTPAEEDELRNFLGRYVEAGRKASTGKRGRPAKSTTAAPTGSGLTPEERSAVREYAAANGVSLAQRGRLPELAVTAWRTQNPQILEHLRTKQAAAA